MDKSTIQLTISLVMIALFSIAIISFCIGFARDNNVPINLSISFDPELSALRTGMDSNMSKFKDESEGTYTSIIDTTIEPGSDVAQSTGPFAITARNIMGVTANIFLLPYKKIFGSGEGFGIFFTTFLAFLLFIAGLLIYKALRGNP